jgi:uncharacterized membrane protein YagU involved in acid resistance
MSISTNMNGSTQSTTQQKVSRLPDIMGLGGGIAGLVGGIAMAIVAAILAASRGNDIWLEAKQIANPLFTTDVGALPGFVAGPVIVGTLIHLFLSIVFGSTYSIIMRRIFKLPSDMGVPVLAGLIFGLTIWMIAYFVVLPIVNPALLDMYQPAFVIQHIVYGIVTGLVYSLVRPLPYSDLARRYSFYRSAEHE